MKLLGKDKFRYFLTYRSVRTQIYLSPRGWDTNSKVRYSRNKEYFGVFRSWALPLDFVYDGADLLRKAYYNGSIETAVKIEVEELNDQTLEYELGFVGDIDFSGKKDDGTVFSVTLMESGPGARIQAYDDLKYEFPLTGDDVVTMILPGIVFTEASDSIFIPFADTPPKRYIPETSLVTESFQSGFAEVQSTSREEMTDTGFEASDNWFARANRDVTLKVKGRIAGTYKSFPFTDNTGFRIELVNNDKSVVRILYNSPTGGRNDYDFEFEYDESVDITDTERLYFYVRNNSTGSAQSIQINDGSLNVSYEDVSDPSECKGLKGIDLFKRIMNKVAPGYSADSSLLAAGRWKDLIFTCGDGIREIDDAKIKWSLSDLYKTINGIDDAALGIDNGVTRIENGYYFARNSQICSVGVVASCELDPAIEFMFSKIKIGYKDGNTDDLNGREEYNSAQEWQSAITRVQTTEDWTSIARGDQFGSEKIRTDYNIKKTTKGTYDIGSDNDVFMFDCYLDGDVYRPILGSTYDSVTGLSSPDSAYNLDLSPKANLLRKGSYLAGVFYNMQNLYINFASATKNAELSVTKNGVVVKQNTAIPINSLPAPYFIPEIAKIKCKLPVAARQMFASNPFGFIHFIFKDTNFYGYILDAAIDIARNTEQEFQLLLTPNTYLPGYVNKVRNIGKQQSGNVPPSGEISYNSELKIAWAVESDKLAVVYEPGTGNLPSSSEIFFFLESTTSDQPITKVVFDGSFEFYLSPFPSGTITDGTDLSGFWDSYKLPSNLPEEGITAAVIPEELVEIRVPLVQLNGVNQSVSGGVSRTVSGIGRLYVLGSGFVEEANISSFSSTDPTQPAFGELVYDSLIKIRYGIADVVYNPTAFEVKIGANTYTGSVPTQGVGTSAEIIIDADLINGEDVTINFIN